MIRTLAFVVLAAGTLTPVAAAARPPFAAATDAPRGFRTTVSYKDLNLATAGGSAALKSRVQMAARDGCDDLYSPLPYFQTWQERNACFRDSIGWAMPQVDQLIRLAARGEPTGTEVIVAYHP